MGEKLELALAVLNGAIGDYLVRTKNGLRTELGLVHAGAPVPLERAALVAAFPEAKSRVVVFVPGLMCTESVWNYPDKTGSYPAHMERDLDVTSLTLRYNTGRSIADNGHDLDAWLTRLVAEYPVPLEEIVLLGFSMGGLVIRSACHVAKLAEDAREPLVSGASALSTPTERKDGTHSHGWLSLVHRCFYVGTPHRGAPLERAGRVLAKVLAVIDDPYTKLIADLANLRSAGVKDLGDADLRHEDTTRRTSGLRLSDPGHPVPLLVEIAHYLVAGTLWEKPLLAELFGDALVPVTSGTFSREGDRLLPPSHIRLFPGLSHMALAHHPSVYEALRTFFESHGHAPDGTLVGGET